MAEKPDIHVPGLVGEVILFVAGAVSTMLGRPDVGLIIVAAALTVSSIRKALLPIYRRLHITADRMD